MTEEFNLKVNIRGGLPDEKMEQIAVLSKHDEGSLAGATPAPTTHTSNIIKEFNLSDKIRDLHYENGYYENEINVEDVKEFIKRLKEIILPEDTQNPFVLYSDVVNKIDKLAGEKLK